MQQISRLFVFFYFSLNLFLYFTHVEYRNSCSEVVCISLVHTGDSWPQHTCIIRPSHWNTEVSIWITHGPSPHASGKLPRNVGSAVGDFFVVAVFCCLLASSCSLNPASVKCSSCCVHTTFLSRRLLVRPSKQKDGCVVVSSLMLHSDRSYPGTPEQPGNRTGTHPEWRTEEQHK